MKESIEEIYQSLEKISQSEIVIDLKVIEKTRSILKARLYFSEELFVQIYINIKKPKRSYTLILNDRRIFGKDYIYGQWHIHSYENPDEHDFSDFAKKEISIEEFIQESFFIASEKLRII
jgi:hypothetical protein